MSGLPGYDAWKTHNPDDDRCEFCGAHERSCRDGWQPDGCTGDCGHAFRDPDAEYEKARDDDDMFDGDEPDDPDEFDHLAARWDHDRDIRKHES